MKVLVTGSEGMLGQALVHGLSSQQIKVEGADIQSGTNKVDITDIDNVVNLIDRIKPDVLIHAAAYTDVDGCEGNVDRAYRVNGEGTKNIAGACRRIDAFLIYISTDYIFDGRKKEAYTEKDRANPLNVYGRSKLMGEEFIKDILRNYLIIRTSWLFGKGSRNFVDTIIDKATTEKRLRIVDDQIGSPTYTVDLAGAITELLVRNCGLDPSPRNFGAQDKIRAYDLPHASRSASHALILNITNSGTCTWYEFAKEIVKIKGLKGIQLEPVTSEAVDRAARRPKMSILDNSKFEKLFGRRLPDWQNALQRYLDVGA